LEGDPVTDTQLRRGGVPVSDLAIVTHDDTLTGDGTTYHPLSSVGGAASSQFVAAFRAGVVDPVPGMPVHVAFAFEPGGITTVQQAEVGAQEPTDGVIAFASTIGMIASVGDADLVTVQTSGFLTLTEDQWDAIADSSGGLSMGSPYYVSAFDNALITPSRPVVPGQYMTRVGFALSSTVMFVQPMAPSQVLGDSILFANWSGSPLPIGSVVYVIVASGVNLVTAAESDSATTAQAIGVVVALDINDNPIVQVAGTTGIIDWSLATVTGTPLSVGQADYVATSANPGKLTTTAPGVGSIVQVGVALNGSRLVLTAPFRNQL